MFVVGVTLAVRPYPIGGSVLQPEPKAWLGVPSYSLENWLVAVSAELVALLTPPIRKFETGTIAFRRNGSLRR
jgi:hypothetical protein